MLSPSLTVISSAVRVARRRSLLSTFQLLLWMRPGEGRGIVLDAVLLVGKRIGNGLPRTHTASCELPLARAAIEGRFDILLDLARNNIMHNDIARSPSRWLEPEL